MHYNIWGKVTKLSIKETVNHKSPAPLDNLQGMAAVEVPTYSVVLYPSPGMGHLVSMVELAKILIRHHFSVTILIVEPHYNTGATAPFIANVSAAHPTISFHRFPSITPPPNPSPHHEALAFDLLRLSNPHLSHFLLSSPTSPAAVIIDLFCSYALDVTTELNIPCYIFYTSGACVLAAHLHFPVLHDTSPASFRELGTTKLSIPGIPPLPANHMTLPILDRDDDAYRGFLYHYRRFSLSTGIIINTFKELETRAIETVSANIPPLYCIGPLVKEETPKKATHEEDCISWLDSQPAQSVVFLCFGSLGVFSAGQLRNIAVGLERSGQRFLWVVRSPPSDDPAQRFVKQPEPDLEKLLPEGFLERTRERGLVVKSWAPQMAVLRHEAVGGFVSHCGWNSVLEAVCAGVPIVSWPLYAEQWMNKVFLVEEMGLAVEMKGYDEEEVAAEEVEEKVRWLMESEGGRELRGRAAAAKERAEAAVSEGGSSELALKELVGRLKGQ